MTYITRNLNVVKKPKMPPTRLTNTWEVMNCNHNTWVSRVFLDNCRRNIKTEE